MAQGTDEQTGKVTNEGGRPTLRVRLPSQPPIEEVEVHQPIVDQVDIKQTTTQRTTEQVGASPGEPTSGAAGSSIPTAAEQPPAGPQPLPVRSGSPAQPLEPVQPANVPQPASSDRPKPAGDGPAGTSATEPSDGEAASNEQPGSPRTGAPSRPTEPPRGQPAPTGRGSVAEGSSAASASRAAGRSPLLNRLNTLRSRFGLNRLLSRKAVQGLLLKNPVVLLAILAGVIALIVLIVGFVLLWQTQQGKWGSKPAINGNAVSDRDDVLMLLAKSRDVSAKRSLMATRGKELLAALGTQEQAEPDAGKQAIIKRLRERLVGLITLDPKVIARYRENNILTALHEAAVVPGAQLANVRSLMQPQKKGGRREEALGKEGNCADGALHDQLAQAADKDKPVISKFCDALKTLAAITDKQETRDEDVGQDKAKEIRKEGDKQFQEKVKAIEQAVKDYAKVPTPLQELQAAWEAYRSATRGSFPPVTAYANYANTQLPEGQTLYELRARSIFSDSRSASRYRSRAGQHNGYDIYASSGTYVIAGWSGTLKTPYWFTEDYLEYGIPVVHEAVGDVRYQVTYGHVTPLGDYAKAASLPELTIIRQGKELKVKPGQSIEKGDVLGRIAEDHVDIKWRDLNKNVPIDWGLLKDPGAQP